MINYIGMLAFILLIASWVIRVTLYIFFRKNELKNERDKRFIFSGDNEAISYWIVDDKQRLAHFAVTLSNLAFALFALVVIYRIAVSSS